MEDREIKDQFISFCGHEKYQKFKDKLRRISEDKYDLRFIQEKRLSDFCDSRNDSITPDDVLSALSDGTEYIYHCPSKACSYIAICIDYGKDIWGCGECGSQWNKRVAFFSSIEESIARYPYREALYENVNDGYIPSDPEAYPNNLKKLIVNEWKNS
ncbi:MAG: hypothetical protein V7765_14980 [Oleispira sp.]